MCLIEKFHIKLFAKCIHIMHTQSTSEYMLLRIRTIIMLLRIVFVKFVVRFFLLGIVVSRHLYSVVGHKVFDCQKYSYARARECV